LEAAVKKDESLIYELGQALPAMDWEYRKRLFEAFVASSPDHAANTTYYLVQKQDERATELLWAMIRDPQVSANSAMGTLSSLKSAYLGQNHYDESRVSAADRKRLTSESLTRLRRGTPLERLVALALIAVSDSNEGLATARDVLNAEVELGPDLRQLALRIVLLAGDAKEAEQTALLVLETDDRDLYAPALALLAGDFSSVMNWAGHGYFLSDLRDHVPYDQRNNYATSSKPFDPVVPKGLTIAHLRRAAKVRTSPEEEYVQYLRILMNDSENLFPLKKWWEKESGNDTARQLLTRAIAYLDDPAHIPLLEQIYAKLSKDNGADTTDFYWTIRIMNGPEIIEFRKRVRDEVGMDKLR
jgi:hypothetical protein